MKRYGIQTGTTGVNTWHMTQRKRNTRTCDGLPTEGAWRQQHPSTASTPTALTLASKYPSPLTRTLEKRQSPVKVQSSRDDFVAQEALRMRGRCTPAGQVHGKYNIKINASGL